MVREVVFSHIYRHPFELVAETYFDKYNNGRDERVVAINILEQRVDPVTKALFVRREGILRNVVPSIARPIFGNEHFIMVEESTIDGRQRTLALETWNISWQDLGDMRERSTYTASSENPNWTVLEQRGTIDCRKCPAFIGPLVEAFAQRLLQAGVRRGTNIMEKLLEERAAAQQRAEAAKEQSGA